MLPTSPNLFLDRLAEAVRQGDRAAVEASFAAPKAGGRYLFEMAADRGGLKGLKVAMIPAPPGWAGYGRYWVVFHTFQDIEEDHDPVYKLVETPGGWRLGPEIAEDDLGGWRIAAVSYRATLHPERASVDVRADLRLKPGSARRAPVFRLNDVYRVASAVGAGEGFFQPRPGQTVRVGSLLIPWTSRPATDYRFDYSGVLDRKDEDKIAPNVAYVTAWWIPSLGRLPFPVRGTIDAPADWVVRGEGDAVGSRVEDGRKISRFSCPLPISYPKVIGGRYVKVAEQAVGDERFRIFQLEPVDSKRARRDLANMVAAAAFYRKTLGPLPFHGYECYDADTYYGIESYSHTLLQRGITHFISHEMGHTYFGGLAPCPYVHDSWNEGVTEYIDSVVLLGDRDRSLEAAFGTLGVGAPLTKMPVAHGLGGASYWRGCYVMKMLESEIGPERVLAALRLIATRRRGLDTRWDDLRPSFEKAGGKRLDWFWRQWVDGATFPTLAVVGRTATAPVRNGFRTVVTVHQSGTPSPFRLRFAVVAHTGGQTTRKVVTLSTVQDSFFLDTPAKPDRVGLEVFPYALARTAP